MSDDRSPFDGRPYYCKTCGAGFGEFVACEDPDCELEPESAAVSRSLTRSQSDLFAPAARSSDPDTAKQSDARHTKLGKRAERARQVLDLIHRHPDLTSGELSNHFWHENKALGIRVAAETPHKRIPDLKRLGLVEAGGERKCADSGYPATVWHVTESGIDELTSDLPF